ncbi:class I SAM-dependent methyltransferase [Mycobacterium paraense]|uniref:class I SAM-dependent methyltransferase n=1 Tax=Mycobacterium paraense TaxID=767916 RepID=UPI000A14974F|nr:class I SAM-dependent methyltransferase [Mycobacterium paraense]MCV7444443.1 class I SAM-dependent methyltransferase [Mycobacterium paraense]ORW44668.1 thiopurine S-methyltransferase [Mycobacterium paraense]
MTELMDWDDAYMQDGIFGGLPPWGIGRPQPQIADFVRHGGFRGDVLDAGCGYGDTSLVLAALGYTVVGIDRSAVAIAQAAEEGRRRRLCNATFQSADITTLSGYDSRFSTIVDSALFHALPVTRRDDYLDSIRRAAAPGASLYILTFTQDAFPEDPGYPIPNLVTRNELGEAVSRHWRVDDIRPAFIHAHAPRARSGYKFDLDADGLEKLPAFLLTAHTPR